MCVRIVTASCILQVKKVDTEQSDNDNYMERETRYVVWLNKLLFSNHRHFNCKSVMSLKFIQKSLY